MNLEEVLECRVGEDGRCGLGPSRHSYLASFGLVVFGGVGGV